MQQNFGHDMVDISVNGYNKFTLINLINRLIN